MTRLIPFGVTSTMRLSGAVNGIVEKATWMPQEDSKRLGSMGDNPNMPQHAPFISIQYS